MLLLKQRNEEFYVEILSNGFVFAYGGRDDNDNWVSDRVFFSDLETLMNVAADYVELPKS